MHRFRTIILIAAGLVLVGCGDRVNVGTVVAKDFVPAHEETDYMQVQTGQTCSGNPPICTPIYMQVPYDTQVPNEWFLKIEGCKAKKGDYDTHLCDELHDRTIQVDESVFDEVQLGDQYEVH